MNVTIQPADPHVALALDPAGDDLLMLAFHEFGYGVDPDNPGARDYSISNARVILTREKWQRLANMLSAEGIVAENAAPIPF